LGLGVWVHYDHQRCVGRWWVEMILHKFSKWVTPQKSRGFLGEMSRRGNRKRKIPQREHLKRQPKSHPRKEKRVLKGRQQRQAQNCAV